MLRIVGSAPPSPGSLQVMVDAIPLRFRAEGRAYYTWELSGNATQLLTVGIDVSSGTLRDVAVVLLGSRMRPSLAFGAQEAPDLPEIDITPAYREVPRVEGLPIVDVSEFEAYSMRATPPVITEARGFWLMKEGYDLYLAFSLVLEPDVCYTVDRVGFMAHAGYLCGLAFYSLRPEELSALEEKANTYSA